VRPRRTIWSDLRSIDQVIVPRVAAAWSRLRRGARPLPLLRTGGATGGSRPVRTLTRLDERFASRGILGLVRDVPQVGIAGLAMLLVVASIVSAVRLGRPADDSGGADLPTVGGAHIATVGPLPGETIPSYLTAAQVALTQQAAESPRQLTHAIVDFDSGRTPEQVAAALPGVQPELLFVRVRVNGDTKTFPGTAEELSAYPTLKAPLHVHLLPNDGITALVKLAASLDEAARDNTTFANTIGSGASSDELAQRAAQLKDARHYRAEAFALRAICACIYAVVVTGTAETLLHILDSGRVRTIDPASPGLKLSEITWVPLRPDVTRTQPAGTSGP